MKWITGILVFLFAAWKLAIFITNRNSGDNIHFVSVDSLQAKGSFSDTGRTDSVKAGQTDSDAVTKIQLPEGNIDTKNIQPQAVVAYAKTLVGVPYKYASTDPSQGFDCSGFVTHVFNHFGIALPRSSIDFTNVGKEVAIVQAKEGDLILFTGIDSTKRAVGHMGIVLENTNSLRFIHSSSGKAKGVVVTPLNGYYKGRYVKTVRIFPH